MRCPSQTDEPVPSLTYEVAGRDGSELQVPSRQLIVAAFTGRDEAANERHIEELAREGIPRPPTVPAFYRLPPTQITQDAEIVVSSPCTSGEVEPVLIRHGGEWYLGVGSDHTDRTLERVDMLLAKAACTKVVSHTVYRYSDIAQEWDTLRIGCRVGLDEQPYQIGLLATMLTPEAVIEQLTSQEIVIDEGTTVFMGTIPTLLGGFEFERHWKIELASSTSSLHASYSVIVAGGLKRTRHAGAWSKTKGGKD